MAAAEPLGDPELLWAAADRLGLSTSVLDPAAADGLLSVSTVVTFRHPTVRSIVYDAAGLDEKRLVHDALAVVTNPSTDPDRRAWHRAHASAQADEHVALELESSAKRAHARGGLAAEAAFLERAAVLTPAGGKRAERALDAADAKLRVGALDDARDLPGLARQGTMAPSVEARSELLFAHIQHAAGAGDAPALLLRAAERLEGLAPELSRETYLAAIQASARAGILSQPNLSAVAARAARAAPRAPTPPRAVDLLLDGYARRYSEGDAAAAPVLAKALAACRGDTHFGDDAAVQIAAMHTAATVRDEQTWGLLANRLAEGARNAGALPVLSSALELLAAVEMFCGEFGRSTRLIDECETIVAAAGGVPVHYAEVMLAALHGHERDTVGVAEVMQNSVGPGEEGWAGLAANMSLAILYNGLGRYASALQPALRAFDLDQTFFGLWAAPEVIEAATRSGKPGVADEAIRRLTAGSGVTDWARGVQARSVALVTDEHGSPEDLYVEAIDRLSRTAVKFELARAHLLYGEWLRRVRRRTDARSHLQVADEMFAAMHAHAFAERAARELRAIGAPHRPIAERRAPQLTSQQTQIALLARDGSSNQEIGALLFISPRTVEYHLRNIFIKLNIASRNELGSALEHQAVPAP